MDRTTVYVTTAHTAANTEELTVDPRESYTIRLSDANKLADKKWLIVTNARGAQGLVPTSCLSLEKPKKGLRGLFRKRSSLTSPKADGADDALQSSGSALSASHSSQHSRPSDPEMNFHAASLDSDSPSKLSAKLRASFKRTKSSPIKYGDNGANELGASLSGTGSLKGIDLSSATTPTRLQERDSAFTLNIGARSGRPIGSPLGSPSTSRSLEQSMSVLASASSFDRSAHSVSSVARGHSLKAPTANESLISDEALERFSTMTMHSSVPPWQASIAAARASCTELPQLMDELETGGTSWLHGRVSRPEANTLLESMELGTFLVRESPTSLGNRTLSVKAPGRVCHFRIGVSPTGSFSLVGKSGDFSNLNSLVKHFAATSLITTPGAPQLKLRRALPTTIVTKESIRILKNRAPKAIRIFFSCPLGGFERERELFFNEQLPQLSQLCEERGGVQLIVTDLRWTLSKEDAENLNRLRIALDEIARCDIFVGLFGARYGWHGLHDTLLQKYIDEMTVNARYSWMEKLRDRSATEIEFYAGHLNAPGRLPSIFLFRDADFDKNEQARLLKKGETAEAAKFEVESVSAARHVADLKSSVLGTSTHTVAIHNNYPQPSVGVQLLTTQLVQLLSDLIPSEGESDDMLLNIDPALSAHETVLASLASSFVGSDRIDELQGAITASNGGLVVLGEPGCGKSSLLATWVANEIVKENQSEIVYLYHFIGSVPSSCDPLDIVKRLTVRLLFITRGEATTMPTDSDKLALLFEECLWQIINTPTLPRVVIVLDGLNQITDLAQQASLQWLPNIPSWSQMSGSRVQFVVSTQSGPCEQTLVQSRHWKSYTISLLSEPERRHILSLTLKEHGKRISSEQADRIVIHEPCRNAMHLRILLDEACAHRDAATLNQCLNELLELKTSEDLLLSMLSRLERAALQREVTEPSRSTSATLGRRLSFKRPTKRVVKLHQDDSTVAVLMQILYASYIGLTELELLAIADVDQIAWSPIFHTLRSHLLCRSDVIGIASKPLQTAIYQRYFDIPDTKAVSKRLNPAQNLVASFFEDELKHPENGVSLRRVAEELPFLLEAMNDEKRLQKCLSHLSVFSYLFHTDKFALIRLWSRTDPATILKLYTESLKKAERAELPLLELATCYNELGTFLWTAGYYDYSAQPFEACLKIREQVQGNESTRLAVTYNDIATIHKSQSHYAEALPLYERALAIYEKRLGVEHPHVATVLSNMSEVYEAMGMYDKALAACHRALLIREKLLGPNHRHISVALNNMASIYKAQGRHDEADPLYQRALQIREFHHGPDHPHVAAILANQATMHYAKGHFVKALALLKRALEIREAKLGPKHPLVASTLISMGQIHESQKVPADALPLYERALAIQEFRFGPNHIELATTLDLLGNLMLAMAASSAEAKAYFNRASSIRDSTKTGPATNSANARSAMLREASYI